jgi:quercetin dioxygenase-like cupin family protein
MKSSGDGTTMSSNTTTTTVLARGAADYPATWALGSLFEQLASGAETGGAFGLSRVTQPPGTATPLHVHSREAEAFYLLDGSMTYRAGEQDYRLSPGSFIYLPAGVPHAFRVTGDAPVSFLAVVAPGGLMDLYDEVGQPAAERRLPGADGAALPADVQRWLEAAPRYGIQVLGPPLPA